ncbi:MAG: cytochrome c [Spirosomataceae bacterium]
MTGNKLYQQNCAACHGADLRGNHDGSYPSLVGINQKMPSKLIDNLLKKGRNMMPSFVHLSIEERAAIIDFIFQKKTPKQLLVPKKVVYLINIRATTVGMTATDTLSVRHLGEPLQLPTSTQASGFGKCRWVSILP